MVSAGMDLEKPRPLQVLVGVRTSVTTGFFSIAACRANEGEGDVCLQRFKSAVCASTDALAAATFYLPGG